MTSRTQTQRERFEETARKLECDEDEEKFNEALKKVAKSASKDKSPAD